MLLENFLQIFLVQSVLFCKICFFSEVCYFKKTFFDKILLKTFLMRATVKCADFLNYATRENEMCFLRNVLFSQSH